MSLTPGEHVGAYRIVEQLGSGGMATVYKAYHAALDRFVALKVMHPAFKGDASFLARFQREAQVVARLDHPHIVPVYDFSEHQGSPYLVMRFVEGETLKARLERGQLTLPEILDVVRPMGEALTYAHEQGVLHRDIKPSNVILAHDGRVFLTDFGLARIVQAGESSLTRDAMVGTPYYISPEQAIGKSELDARTDIYSFGVVLYELLTGRVPFQSDTPFAVVHDHIYTPLPLPSAINPNLPPALERVLLKAMAKEPHDRYDSALELVTAAEAAVTGKAAIPLARAAVTPAPAPTVTSAETAPTPKPFPEPTPAETAPTPKPFPEPTPVPVAPPMRPPKEQHSAGKKPWLLILGGLAVLAVMAVAAVLLLGGGADKEPEIADRPPSVQDASAALETALEMAAEGDVEQALAILEETVGQDPDAAGAYLDLARFLLQQEELEGAIEVLQQGVRARPDDPALHLMLGQTLVVAEEWEEAVPEFQWLLEHASDMAEPHAYLGAYLIIEVEDAERARAEIDRALELDPESPVAHFAQGLYFWKLGNFRMARRELQRAQESSRASPWLRQRIQTLLEEEVLE